jgi:CheY-like chemotaxis protein
VASTTVLVVEDDEPTRTLYRNILLGAGFRVIAVDDGADVLEMLQRNEYPDAIVLDLGLPRLPGLEVYKELRARADTQCIPIIVATGLDLDPQLRATFRFVLQKPIAPEVLLFAVDNALRQAHGIHL